MGEIPMKIVSGGQTGADIAALDAAIALAIPHGGWCPLGRRSLAGPIPKLYRLRETPSPDYIQRTEWNVRDSDATLILTLSPELTGGSRATLDFARKHQKPHLHLADSGDHATNRSRILRFLASHPIQTLNVAGPREQTQPGTYSFVRNLLESSLAPHD